VDPSDGKHAVDWEALNLRLLEFQRKDCQSEALSLKSPTNDIATDQLDSRHITKMTFLSKQISIIFD
jgi:hypothetical protein